ncbi:hypothetical protein QWJ34_21555 [Saccharibacillus sp. CPCC 101409]|uniref:hypothetical protein n=1 Tax=Saccharibacillus sp. CPCC 101409 TaxID=3058041 RepID=UPI0026713F88|nr:hypothetical protein [Saccharibacillus sp. CPCC 101409]MDO3412365.1 hypothetical protein [Saccharibacillus sp. CPCC 101409]
MANEGRPEDTETMTREEREAVGRRANAGFARHERTESVDAGSGDIPTRPIIKQLSEEEIRRRVGDGNFESAQNDGQTGSINS